MLINTNLLRRQKWPLGLIVEVLKSRAGEIRSAIVRCRGKLYKRAVCQLIPLEVESFDGKRSSKRSCSNDMESEDASHSQPNHDLPSPAVFEIPQGRYAPNFFSDSGAKDSLVHAPHNAELPIIGEKIEGEEDIDYDEQYLDFEAETAEFVDPNAVESLQPDIPIGRTREYRPRKAKKPNVNYVHQVIVDYLSSSSSPPECCEFCPKPVEPHNLFAL